METEVTLITLTALEALQPSGAIGPLRSSISLKTLITLYPRTLEALKAEVTLKTLEPKVSLKTLTALYALRT